MARQHGRHARPSTWRQRFALVAVLVMAFGLVALIIGAAWSTSQTYIPVNDRSSTSQVTVWRQQPVTATATATRWLNQTVTATATATATKTVTRTRTIGAPLPSNASRWAMRDWDPHQHVADFKAWAYNRIGPTQFLYLDKLWIRESGWNRFANNATSSAYGIPQALPGSKMAAFGDDWRWNGYTQMKWGLWYIKDRYGTARAAWAHSEAYNWY